MKDIDDLFDVAYMVDREGQGKEPEMPRAVHELLAAGLAHAFLVPHALPSRKKKVPVGGRGARAAGACFRNQRAGGCAGAPTPY